MTDAEQSQYIIREIVLTTERFPGEELDLNKSVVELNIFEDIEKPYLTATLMLVDNVALKSTVGIKGTERVSISLQAAGSQTVRTKKFLVTGIAKEISNNERTDVRVLTMIEEHAYISAIKKFSKSYRNTPEGIIQDILESHLNKELDAELVEFPAQKPMRVNIPYWTPLETVDWIRDRMSTTFGSPFFTYATFRDDTIKLGDLGTIMQQDAWNKETPYTYGQAAHNIQAGDLTENNQIRKYFFVQSYKASEIESTLKMAQAGAIGSYYNVADITTGYKTEGDQGFHSGLDTLEQFITQQGYPETSGIGFDGGLDIGVPNSFYQNVSMYPSKVFSSVVASRLFYDEAGYPLHSYHDEMGNPAAYNLKIKSAALRAMLMNNVYTISVPGAPYLIKDDVGVGSNIKLHFADNTVDDTRASAIDPNRSGKFLVYRARHKFVDGKYDVHMDIVKLTKETT